MGAIPAISVARRATLPGSVGPVDLERRVVAEAADLLVCILCIFNLP